MGLLKHGLSILLLCVGKIWVGKSLSRGMDGKIGMGKETYLGTRFVLTMKASTGQLLLHQSPAAAVSPSFVQVPS